MQPKLEGAWTPRNRERLESLLADPGEGNYAVFDWDNTCVFLDVEEATLAYQLEHLAFAATPDQMKDALRRGLPDDPEVTGHLHKLDHAYCSLHPGSSLLGQGNSLGKVANSPQHRDFRARFLALYTLLEHRYGPEVAYPWLPLRFVGMTAEQVKSVAAGAIRWQMECPITTVDWQGDGVSVRWRSGLRLLPEMRSLQQGLESVGIDVWVCTASFAEVIRAVASDPAFGYAIAPERILGLELETDPHGRYLPCLKAGGDITYAEGKSASLRRHLLPRYGRGPLLVAGDSNGDVAMMCDFDDTRVGLFIDTGRPADSALGRLAARARGGDPRYLCQPRDEARGCWLPS